MPAEGPTPARPGSEGVEYRDAIDHELKRKPEGYHKMAETLMGPFPELTVMRRFGALNALCLLSLQAELTQLELQLKKASVADHLLSFQAQLERAEDARPQWDLILSAREKLKEYNEALLQVASVAALPKPGKNNVDIFRDWLDVSDRGGKRNFLDGAELLTWGEDNTHDLVALKSKSDEDPLARWFASHVLVWYHRCIGHRRGHGKVVDAETGIAHYSDTRLARFAILFASTISSLLPVIAIVILYFVEQTKTRIWIMIGLTTAFATVLATVTSARSQDVFAATAAFAAVEVVFIGSVTNSACVAA